METKIKPKKLSKLKPKERLFVETYFKTDFNGTESVKRVYGDYSEGFSRVKAHRLLTKSNVAQAVETKRQTLKEALEEQGINPKKLAEKIDNLLEAETPIYKNNNATKTVELVGYAPDYTAIDKGLKHATNIYGIEDLDTKPKSNTTYNFIFNEQTQAEIRQIEDKIKQRLINGDSGLPTKT